MTRANTTKATAKPENKQAAKPADKAAASAAAETSTDDEEFAPGTGPLVDRRGRELDPVDGRPVWGDGMSRARLAELERQAKADRKAAIREENLAALRAAAAAGPATDDEE